jgi:hypothetical protein
MKRYSNNTGVKSGTKLRRESEVAACHLTAQFKLRTPRVLEITESISDGDIQTNISMTFIQGQSLDSI